MRDFLQLVSFLTSRDNLADDGARAFAVIKRVAGQSDGFRSQSEQSVAVVLELAMDGNRGHVNELFDAINFYPPKK